MYQDLWCRRNSTKRLPNFGVGYSTLVKFTARWLYPWRKELYGELGVKNTCPTLYVVGKKLAKLVCLLVGDTKFYKCKK
jgi:hypothetical protein